MACAEVSRSPPRLRHVGVKGRRLCVHFLGNELDVAFLIVIVDIICSVFSVDPQAKQYRPHSSGRSSCVFWVGICGVYFQLGLDCGVQSPDVAL